MQSIRERLRERRRQKRWRVLRLCLCFIAAVSAVVYGWRYLHQPGLAFGDVTINGSNLISETDVIKMSGSEPPFNIFNADIGRLKEALAHDVRFQNTEVHYHWPASLQVMVQEREPALYVANSYRSYLQVDFNGLVLNVTTGIPDAKAPVLAGVQCGNVYIGDTVNNQAVLNILQFLQQIGGEAQDAVAEIAVDNRQEVTLRMRNSFPIIVGAVDDLPNKAEVFLTVFNEIKNKNIKAEYIDLTFAKPYIKLMPEEKK